MSTLVIKTCPICGKEFRQSGDTHNDRVYSGWIKHENFSYNIKCYVNRFRNCKTKKEKEEYVRDEFAYDDNDIDIDYGEEKLECLSHYDKINKKRI